MSNRSFSFLSLPFKTLTLRHIEEAIRKRYTSENGERNANLQ